MKHEFVPPQMDLDRHFFASTRRWLRSTTHYQDFRIRHGAEKKRSILRIISRLRVWSSKRGMRGHIRPASCIANGGSRLSWLVSMKARHEPRNRGTALRHNRCQTQGRGGPFRACPSRASRRARPRGHGGRNYWAWERLLLAAFFERFLIACGGLSASSFFGSACSSTVFSPFSSAAVTSANSLPIYFALAPKSCRP
jgi:hypothetical protein